ncbi:MAG: hypothetical protein J1F60_08365 [Oscillospiraceae bacterium]|nr:hypothetical protein [Oscillospiraceae bacterium]
MKKLLKIALAATLILTLTACDAGGAVDDQIQIPIYQPEQFFSTATVKRMDLTSSQSLAASIGYAFSDALSTARDGNLISINVNQYQELKKGDVIAVIDSSALTYTYLEQDIITQAAYERYLATGSEADRLTYEYELATLNAVQYEIDCYTITAPYDCIVTDVVRMLDPGTELSAGTYICSVAYPDDIYVYLAYDAKSSPNPFRLGGKVSVTLTGSAYEGTVVSIPVSTAYKYGDSYAVQHLGWGGGGTPGGPTSADSSKYAIIGFEPEVLSALLEETPNAVIAGWATVAVTTQQLNNVLCVPSSAVKKRDTTYVYLYENGQRLQMPVITGATVNGYTMILGGLREGDEIVL